jgi:hypothetical protein
MAHKDPEKKRAYYKEWREKNKEKVKQKQKEYAEKNKEKRRQNAKLWREENPERSKTAQKEWYEKNKERLKSLRKSYYKTVMSDPEKRQEKRNRANKYKKARPLWVRNAWLKTKFGITLEDKKKILADQNGACGICKKPLEMTGRDSNVDHCHNSGKVRGVLCRLCNVALGQFKDSIEILQSAIDYLKKHQN